MNKNELDEAIAATQRVLSALLSTLHGSTGQAGAELRWACGQVTTNGPAMLYAVDPNFWTSVVVCFEDARLAGATFAAMDAVRVVAQGLAPRGTPAIAVKNFAMRLALAEQAQILAATTFTSREDIDRCFDLIDPAFETAEQIAADSLDNIAYTALISLHAAVSNDLANRERPLPRMVSYTFGNRAPSLWLAQRLYADASRNDELIAENKPVHPLFMPPSGVALSA
jgi:prophage DNA circulation protein